MNGVREWIQLAKEQAGALLEVPLQRQRGATEAKTEVKETRPTGGGESGTQPTVPPLSAEEWTGLMDSQGRFSDDNAREIMRRAFYGGFSENIRSEAWKFLLHMYPFNTTSDERHKIDRDKTSDYHVLKMQWKSMLPEQLKRCTKFANRVSQIDKDIVRTDRDYPFFEKEESLDELRDILVTFITYNQDLGYTQGMNDLCAIIYNVLHGDEAATFWCFANLMERLGAHFHKDQVGMTTTLRALARVLCVVDPELYHYLETVDAANLFFCFRWMLVFFKREFSFDSTKRVWEAVLSDYLCPHTELFFACAMVEESRDEILGKRLHLDELMLLMNTLAGTRCTTPLVARCDALFRTFMARATTDAEIHAYVVHGLHTLSDAVVLDADRPRPRAASATIPMTRDPAPASPVPAPAPAPAPPVYNPH